MKRRHSFVGSCCAGLAVGLVAAIALAAPPNFTLTVTGGTLKFSPSGQTISLSNAVAATGTVTASGCPANTVTTLTSGNFIMTGTCSVPTCGGGGCNVNATCTVTFPGAQSGLRGSRASAPLRKRVTTA